MSSYERIKFCAIRSLELFRRWGVKLTSWCLLDGPAIKLLNPGLDVSAWHDHLNLYVDERELPWPVKEAESTLPPPGSDELANLIGLARDGIHLHLVPAQRYFEHGFETCVVKLDQHRVQVASMRGCVRVWSYKSVELVYFARRFEGDVARLTAERLERLDVALAIASDKSVRNELRLLKRGYERLAQGDVTDARDAFVKVAGDAWRDWVVESQSV